MRWFPDRNTVDRLLGPWCGHERVGQLGQSSGPDIKSHLGNVAAGGCRAW